VCMGVGTILASIVGNRVSQKLGPGVCMVTGVAICGIGWGLLAIAPNNLFGVIAFALMLICYAVGGVFIFINFLALRQAVTPEALLGRTTSTMRWLTLIPAGPGALLGGWLGEHLGLRYALGFSCLCALILALLAWRNPTIRSIKSIPKL
jgi:MFS family permease